MADILLYSQRTTQTIRPVASYAGSSADAVLATTIAATYSAAHTADTTGLLVAAISWDIGPSNDRLLSSVVDSVNGAWTILPLYSDTTNKQGIALAYKLGVASGTPVVTATFSTTTDFRRIRIATFTGVGAFEAQVGVSNGTNTAGGIATPGAQTPTVDGALIVGGVMDTANGSNTQTPNPSFTLSGASGLCALEWFIQPAAGSIAASWTFGTAGRYAASQAVFRPATTGTDNPLSGTVGGSSTGAGSLVGRLALVGAAAATSAVVGAIGVSQGLSGTVAATSTASGDLTAQHPLSGTAAAIGATTGSPVAVHPLNGTAAGTSAVVGSLASTQALAGTVAAVSATTGNAAVRAPLAGTVAGTSSTVGALSSRQGLTGTTAATSTTSGTFFEAGPQTYPLTGTSAATTASAGTVTVRRALTGQTAAVTGTSGSTTAQHPLGGSIASSTDTTGTVTLRVTLDGSTTVLSAVTGAVTTTRPLSGTVTADTTTTGRFGELTVLDLTIKDTLPPLAVRQPRPPLAVTDARPPLGVRGPLPALAVVDTRPALTVRKAP